MARTINVSKTVTLRQDVFMYLADMAEEQDVTFSAALNEVVAWYIAERRADQEAKK